MGNKTKTKKTRTPPPEPGGEVLLDADQQREILAVGLVALAVFVLLSLVSLGERSAEMFPSGNAMGVVGGTVDAMLVAGLGMAAGLVPVLLLLSGLHVGGWVESGLAGRLAVLVGGLLVISPLGLYVLTPNPAAGGWVGEAVGMPLVRAVGWLGGALVLFVLLVGLLVATLRWNPLRTVAAGVAHGGGVLGRTLHGAGRALAERRAANGGGEEAAAGGAVTVADGSPPPDEPFHGETPEAAPLPPKRKRTSRGARKGAALMDELLDDPAVGRSHEHDALPPLGLLDLDEQEGRPDMERQLDQLGQVLVEKLRTFNVQSTLGGRTTGPVVTQFEVVPAAGVKVNRIANLDADLALAMKAPSIRIVAPIPGKGAVGVEIPNPEARIVQLREILQAREFQRARGDLPLALGKDLTGRSYVADLGKMPHLLIAGATGSGKSVCVNTIVTSLAYRHTPDSLRLLMIDPKMVELSTYADLPHLRHPVVTDPHDAAGVLKWAVLEMERRYQLLSANGVRSIGEFNQRVKDGVVLRRIGPRPTAEGVGADDGEGEPGKDGAPAGAGAGDGQESIEDRWIYDDGRLPYIVVVVDELADLMMQVQSDIEKPLAQLAQKARAIGIHLIVATQRPSVNVITGLIKANFPTRIAFRVASKTDSRTILDQNGAEALLGNGDMLFLPPGQSEPVRIQGAFIATEETDRLISWYRAQEAHRLEAEADGEETPRGEEPDILDEVREAEQVDAADLVEEIMGDWDELFRAAAEVCITQDQGSTSLLQRRLRIGYGRAARIVDQLHDAGVLGPPDGSKPREVLVGLDALDEICGPAT